MHYLSFRNSYGRGREQGRWWETACFYLLIYPFYILSCMKTIGNSPLRLYVYMIELSPTLDNRAAEETCVLQRHRKEQRINTEGQTRCVVPTLSLFSLEPCSVLVFYALGNWSVWTKSKLALSAFWLPVKQLNTAFSISNGSNSPSFCLSS